MDRREFIKNMSVLGGALLIDDFSDRDYDESCVAAEHLDKYVEQLERSVYLIMAEFEDCSWKQIKGIVKGDNILTVAHGILNPGMKRKKTTLAYSSMESVELEDVYINEEDDIAILKYPRVLNTDKGHEPFHLAGCPFDLGDANKLKKGDYLFASLSYGHPMQKIFNEGKVMTTSKDHIYHSMDTYPGDSGSPIVALFDGEPHVVGIATGWGENQHVYQKGGVYWEVARHKLANAVKINKYAKHMKG